MEHICEDSILFGPDHWFTWKNLYSRFVQEFPSGSKFVEVGVWKGRSVSYLAVEVVNSGKDIKIDAIDSFEGDLGCGVHMNDPLVRVGLLHNYVEKIMERFNGTVKTIKSLSWEAAHLYPDESVDVVFIDACHDYSCVKRDIQAWFPKIKVGGYIAGHDYSIRPDTKQAVDELLHPIEETEGCFVFKKTSSKF
jgi:hypothetical protein